MATSFTQRALDILAETVDLSGWTAEMSIHGDPRQDRLLIKTADGRVAGKAWFDKRGDGIRLMFTDDVTDCRPGFRKVLKGGWEKRVAESAVLACLITKAPDDRLVKIIRSQDLTPAGKVYRAGLVKLVQEMVLRDLGPPKPGTKMGWDKVTDHLKWNWPAVAVEAVHLLEHKFKSLSGEDVKVSLGAVRGEFKFLIARGIPFEEVGRVWDEETVRNVQEL